MRASLSLRQNLATPDLLRRARALSGEGKRQLLEKIGLSLVSLAKRSFATDPGLRPSPWANKADGTPSTLTLTTRLRKSIKSTAGTDLVISSDAPYAAIHQRGGKTRPHVIRAGPGKVLPLGNGRFAKKVNHPGSKMPPRPFLPFLPDGSLTPRANRNVLAIITTVVGP